MREKRILYVATVVKTHIAQFHLPYIEAMHNRGWHTAVAAKNDYQNPSELNIPNCDDYYDIPFCRNPLKRGNLKAYRMLKETIDNGEYDIVHCHTPVGAILARLACRDARQKGTKVIYTAHGFHFFKGAPLLNWLIYFPAEWICAFMTDVLITINREDYLFAQKHMHARKIMYVPGVGVDFNRFGISPDRRNELRNSLGVKENEFLLLSVAELTKNKNQTMILDALHILNNPRIRFVSAGRGECMKALQAKVVDLGLSDTAAFLGYRNDANELYGAADAFVFPSFREGLSLALMESMASGIPSIVGKIRGNTDLITDGEEGLYIQFNAKDLAEKIDLLYRNSELCEKLGKNAQNKVRQFGLQPVLDSVVKIYLDETGEYAK